MSELPHQAVPPAAAASTTSRRRARAGPMSASTSTGSRAGESVARGDRRPRSLPRPLAGRAAVRGRRRGFRRHRRAHRRPSRASPGRSMCRPARPGSVDGRRRASSSRSARRPAAGHAPARLIAPDASRSRRRAAPAPTPATSATSCPRPSRRESLLVVEVITPAGHWSSYPPHKHDRDALPRGVAARGDLLSPPRPAAGLRLPARLHGRPLPRRDDRRRGPRRGAGAARLPSRSARRTATTSIISTSWPGRTGPGASTTTRPMPGCSVRRA